MKKLILFGDSLIALFHKNEIAVLEQKTGHEVYNCATSGWDTFDGAAKAPYIAQLKPDIVVLSFGTNDSAPWKNVDLATAQKNVGKIINAFDGSRIIFLLPPPTKDERRSNDSIQQYADAFKTVISEKSIEYIDSWQVFKAMFDAGINYHETDNLHFNEVGCKTVIDEITKRLTTKK